MELKDTPDQARLLRWKSKAELEDPIQPNQHLPPSKDLIIIMENHQWLWTGVVRTRFNIVKWGINNKEDDKCECGEWQTDEHQLNCTIIEWIQHSIPSQNESNIV